MSYEKLFDKSYERVKTVIKNDRSFFDAFYDRFIQSSAEVAQHFKHTDMQRQKKILEKSFYSLLIFYATNNANDYLEEIAIQHSKSALDINPGLYDLWLESLIETVKEYDDHFTPETELSWRLVLSVGITYMKFKYDT